MEDQEKFQMFVGLLESRFEETINKEAHAYGLDPEEVKKNLLNPNLQKNVRVTDKGSENAGSMSGGPKMEERTDYRERYQDLSDDVYDIMKKERAFCSVRFLIERLQRKKNESGERKWMDINRDELERKVLHKKKSFKRVKKLVHTQGAGPPTTVFYGLKEWKKNNPDSIFKP